jgi:hypothetical protein
LAGVLKHKGQLAGIILRPHDHHIIIAHAFEH